MEQPVHVEPVQSRSVLTCSHREDVLRAALAAHEDVDVLQNLCEGGKVPTDLRVDLWKVSLTPSLCRVV